MGRKIFISYKYADYAVANLPGNIYTKSRDYVTYIQNNIFPNIDGINKAEKDDEDLSLKSEDSIWNELKDKIFDSSVTIVLISPNMKENNKWQRSQWIPWELHYSLYRPSRNGIKSLENSILAVVLPNIGNSYSYFDKNTTFPILKDNIINGYIYTVNWNEFIKYPNYYIDKADEAKANTPEYLIKKNL